MNLEDLFNFMFHSRNNNNKKRGEEPLNQKHLSAAGPESSVSFGLFLSRSFSYTDIRQTFPLHTQSNYFKPTTIVDV